RRKTVSWLRSRRRLRRKRFASCGENLNCRALKQELFPHDRQQSAAQALPQKGWERLVWSKVVLDRTSSGRGFAIVRVVGMQLGQVSHERSDATGGIADDSARPQDPLRAAARHLHGQVTVPRDDGAVGDSARDARIE